MAQPEKSDSGDTRAERRRKRRGRNESVQQGQGHGKRTYVPNVKKGSKPPAPKNGRHD